MIETVCRERRSAIAGEKNMSHFPFRGSPNNNNNTTSNQNTVSSTPPSPSGPLAMAVTSTIPPGARSASPCSATSGPPTSRCCDSGRPLFTDPATGQTVCSCQQEQLINYHRLQASASIIGHGGMPLPAMYNAAYSGEMSPYLPGVGPDQAHYYPNLAGLELKENLAGGAPWPYPYPYTYDPTFAAAYPFNGYGMDINGARRKNATRETTSMLKAWLNEHKKNPYPTKGEKIMLAIITKMTLTQVSTWFANARRRLKKENKMTWEPRNRVDDDDPNMDDDDNKSTDGKEHLDSKDSGTASSEDGDKSSNRLTESRPESRSGSPDICDKPPGGGYPLIHPALHHFRPPMGSPPTDYNKHTPGSSTNPNVINKPRIWSLADMASNKEDKDSDPKPPSMGFYQTGPGKIISPLASRIPYPSPYAKPDMKTSSELKSDFYRNFYTSASAAHMHAHPDAALIEQYQRAFAAHNGLTPMNHLSSVISKATGGVPPFAPLSLTTNHANHGGLVVPPSGVSPSASSTSSRPENSTPTASINERPDSEPINP